MFDWFKKPRQAAASAAPQSGDGSAFFNALRDSAAAIPAGEYAMWFSSPEEGNLAGSASLQAIDRLYRAAAGIEEAVLAVILRQRGKVGPDIRRVALPDDTQVMALVTGAGQLFLASVHQEKGIRLHFPRPTPVPRRSARKRTGARLVQEARGQRMSVGMLGITLWPACGTRQE